MVVVWRYRGNTIRTAMCCVVYDSNVVHNKCEQFLNLCLVRVRLVLVCFKGLVCIFVGMGLSLYFCVSLC